MSEIILNGETWLGSQEKMVLKTATLTSESGTTVTENGRTIIKAGSLINDAVLGYGLLYRDVDVTDGARVGQVMIRGNYINSGLPSSLSTEQKDALAAVGLFDIEKSVLQLHVEPVAGTETLFGKSVSELQENILVGAGAVVGSLNYVEGYTQAFPGDEANGHFLALKATALHNATIKAQLINGVHGEVTLDSDGIIVCRVANNNQSVRFKAIYGDDTETVEYNFTNLELIPKKYTITTSITNGSISGATEIYAEGSANLTLTANDGYDLPTSITVSGTSTFTYDYETGAIVIYNPTENVTITAVCPTATTL